MMNKIKQEKYDFNEATKKQLNQGRIQLQFLFIDIDFFYRGTHKNVE